MLRYRLNEPEIRVLVTEIVVTGITPKQKECLECISHYISQNGHSPSLAEIGETLSQSAVAIHHKVNSLAERGYLTKTRGKRTLALTRKSKQLLAHLALSD